MMILLSMKLLVDVCAQILYNEAAEENDTRKENNTNWEDRNFSLISLPHIYSICKSQGFSLASLRQIGATLKQMLSGSCLVIYHTWSTLQIVDKRPLSETDSALEAWINEDRCLMRGLSLF